MSNDTTNQQPSALALAPCSAPTLATHNARKARNGLSRWWIKTPTGVRSIKLQSYKGRLYLYGMMIDRSRRSLPTIALRFEATLAEIKQIYGTPFLPNTKVSRDDSGNAPSQSL